jgi:uncharacterized membrane protein YphA (DoxX/SURF4 family)
VNLPSPRTYAWWLGLVRILTGVIWLIHAAPKFLNSAAFLPPAGFFGTYLQQGIAGTVGPYHDFMVSVVLPNAAIFAELVRLGEVLVGISLVLGLLTRAGGFFGLLLPLNYMAARGAMGTVSGWSSGDAALALLSAISFVLPTGRALGADAIFVRRRIVRKPVVVPEIVPEPPMAGPTAPTNT